MVTKWLKLLISTVVGFLLMVVIGRGITIPPLPWNIVLKFATLGAIIQFLFSGLAIEVWRKDGN